MTSNERRREARYQRRKMKRFMKKMASCQKYNDYFNIICLQSLYKAYKLSRRCVSWKNSVQNYHMNLFKNLYTTYVKLLNHEDIVRGFVEFNTIERGKKRHIKSVHISERVVQRSLCDNSLVPILSRSLIDDNTACIKGKGVDRALDRFEAHLQKFYRDNGFSNDGYIVYIDDSSYFDTLLHSYIDEILHKAYDNEEIIELVNRFVRPFGYPSVDGNWRKTKKPVCDGDYSGKSLGLGSQVSQILAVSYPSMIDHYIKDVMRMKYYDHYMDDTVILCKTKEEAKAVMAKIKELSDKIGIIVSDRKSHIAKLTRPVRYLKVNFKLTKTGKVLRSATKSNIVKERRRLKKYKQFLDSGRLTIEEITQAYASWKGYVLRRDSIAMSGRKSNVITKMDNLFRSLFGAEPPVCSVKINNKKKWRM